MTEIITAISDLISKPAFWVLVAFGIVYCGFMSWIDVLEAPTEKSSKRYRMFFKWANRFSFRMKRAERALHIAPKTQVMSAEDVKKACEHK